MIKMKTGVSVAASAAMLALSMTAATPSYAAKSKVELVHCYGVNSCKGTSDCKSGNHECKGLNDCKGQGFKAESAKQCAADGGSLTPST